MSFSYVNITGKECKGWLNLFFGEYCVAMVNDVDLANDIRKEISIKPEDDISKIFDDCYDEEEYIPK